MRTKLIIGSMALSLIPLIVLSVINNRYIENLYREQTVQTLTTHQTNAQSIDDFKTLQEMRGLNQKLSAIQDTSRWINSELTHSGNQLRRHYGSPNKKR
jgi:hypothetical protein